jgi:alcohol dehydrogenase (cytochrome c)
MQHVAIASGRGPLDDTTLKQLWKINVGSAFAAPAMTFEVGGKQYIAIASGRSPLAKRRVVNTPELKDQSNATVVYVFGL